MGYRNLLPMTVTGGGGGLATATGHGIELTGRVVGLAGTAGAEVGPGPAVVAVRPEDFVVGDPPADETNRVDVGIEVVEYHGRELAVQARLPQGRALLLRTPTRVSRGETVTVWVPADRVLVFGNGNTTDGPPAEEAAGPSAGVAATPVPDIGAARDAGADREHEVTPS